MKASQYVASAIGQHRTIRNIVQTEHKHNPHTFLLELVEDQTRLLERLAGAVDALEAIVSPATASEGPAPTTIEEHFLSLPVKSGAEE